MKIAIITNIGRITEAGATKHIYLGRCEDQKFYAITRNTVLAGQVTADFTFLPKTALQNAIGAGTAVVFSQEGVERLEQTAEDAITPLNSAGVIGSRFLSGTVRNGMMLPRLVGNTSEPFGSIWGDGISKKSYQPAATSNARSVPPINNFTPNVQPTQQIAWIPYFS